MNKIQVERLSSRQNQIGQPADKAIRFTMRQIRPFEHADPFRITHQICELAFSTFSRPAFIIQWSANVIQHRHYSICLNLSISVEVEEVTEFGCAVRVGLDKNGHAR